MAALFTASFWVMELGLVPNTVIWALDFIHLHCCTSSSSRGKLLKYQPLLKWQLSIVSEALCDAYTGLRLYMHILSWLL